MTQHRGKSANKIEVLIIMNKSIISTRSCGCLLGPVSTPGWLPGSAWQFLPRLHYASVPSLYLNLPGPSSSRAETVLTEVRRLTTIVDSLWNECVYLLDPRLLDGPLHPSPRDPRGMLICGAGPLGCTIHTNRCTLKSTNFLEANSLGTPLKR